LAHNVGCYVFMLGAPTGSSSFISGPFGVAAIFLCGIPHAWSVWAAPEQDWVILIGLDLVGLTDSAKGIQQRWEALLGAIRIKPTPTYRKACPQRLLQQAAIHALEGAKKIGCRVVDAKTADNVHGLLNAAWDQFWSNPTDYHAWERDVMTRLKERTVGRETCCSGI